VEVNNTLRQQAEEIKKIPLDIKDDNLIFDKVKITTDDMQDSKSQVKNDRVGKKRKKKKKKKLCNFDEGK
jgi:hypothetical protein